jgi:trehalose-phosphatase
LIVTAPWFVAALQAHRAGRGLALFFDYDGTLTPLVAHPDAALLPAETRALLAQLASSVGVIVGILSGRALADLRYHVGLPDLYYAGCAGSEIDLRGHIEVDPAGAQLRPRLERIQADLRAAGPLPPGCWVEVKPLGLSIHYRHVDAALLPAFHATCLDVLAAIPGLRVRDVALAFEVTALDAWHKGTAIERILAHAGGDLYPVYAGDSDNDTPALEVVARQGGTTLGIGPEAPPGVQVRFPDPATFSRSLSRLVQELHKEVGFRKI